MVYAIDMFMLIASIYHVNTMEHFRDPDIRPTDIYRVLISELSWFQGLININLGHHHYCNSGCRYLGMSSWKVLLHLLNSA